MDDWQKKLALLKKQREESRAGGTTAAAAPAASSAPKPSPFASAASRTAPAGSFAPKTTTTTAGSSGFTPKITATATSGYAPSSASVASRGPTTTAASSSSAPAAGWRTNSSSSITSPASPPTAAPPVPAVTVSSAPASSSIPAGIPTSAAAVPPSVTRTSLVGASPVTAATPAATPPPTVTRTSLVGGSPITKPLPQAPTSSSTSSPPSTPTATAASSPSPSPSGSYRSASPARHAVNLTASSSSSTSPSSSGGVPIASPSSSSSSSSAAAGAAGGPISAERELSLLKTEHKMLTMKYESEVRKREALDRQVAQMTQELDQLKSKRSGAGAQAMVEKTKADMERTNRKRMMELKSQRLKSQADQLAADNRASVVLSPGAKTLAAGGDPADRRASRMATRKSRTPTTSSGSAPKTNIVDIISRVLEEMMRLEGNMKKAEDGRMKAEGELLEVAMYKQASDEALQAVVTDIRQQVVQMGAAISALDGLISQNPPNAAILINAREKFIVVKNAIEQRIDENRLAGEQPTAEVVNKRASVYAQKLQLPPPPPPLDGLSAPAAPAAPVYISPAQRASRRGPAAALAEQSSGSRTSTLLDQIRKGKNLTKIDVEALKRDREDQLKKNRKSMALLSSLQETLRLALNARSSEMNLYSEDDSEEWEEEDDWDEDQS